MTESFKTMKLVPGELLQQRLETVKELSRHDSEYYEIAKDRETGEHYLHYAYLQINVSAGAIEQYFHQLLPLESDDVLGLIFGEDSYTYPDHWKCAFLRNGPDDQYVWFDPSSEEDYDKAMEVSNQLQQKLLKFKQAGKLDEESLRKLFDDLDKL